MAEQTVLAAAAMACAGEGQCCQVLNEDGTCCMTERTREIFAAIELAGGPSLEQCEAIARGDLWIVARVPMKS